MLFVSSCRLRLRAGDPAAIHCVCSLPIPLHVRSITDAEPAPSRCGAGFQGVLVTRNPILKFRKSGA